MVTPTVGVVVLVRFPFSDLTASKLRPAVVLANADRGDWVLCQITSRSYADPKAVPITSSDFSKGTLTKSSHARPAKLFTANSGIIVREIGELSIEKLSEILSAVISLFGDNLENNAT